MQEVLRRAKANAAREAEEAASVARAEAEAYQGEAEAARRSAQAESARSASERLQRKLRYRQIGKAVGTVARWVVLGLALAAALLFGLITEGVLPSPFRLVLLIVGASVSALSVLGVSLGSWIRSRAVTVEARVAKSLSEKAEDWFERSAHELA